MTRSRTAFAHASGSWQATSTSAGSMPRRRSRVAPPTIQLSGGSFESSGKRRSSSSRNMIAQRADPLDLDLDRIAGSERTDARRRAGEDHVAGHERHHGRDELDEHVAREDHVARIAVLPDLAVHARNEAQGCDVEIGLDHRTDRTERVEALPPRVLHVFLLQVARGDVVAAGESENVLAPVAAEDVAGAAADH